MQAAVRKSKGERNTYLQRQTLSIQEQPGKLPPQAIDLEEAVIGAVLLERGALSEVVSFLKEEHFYKPQHQAIWSAVIELFNESDPIDMRTVVSKLRKMGKLEFAGGAYYVAELTSKMSSAANVEYHARIIVEMWMKRELISLFTIGATKGFEDTTDVFELLDWSEGRLFALSEENTRGVVQKMPSLMQQAIANMIKRAEHGGTGLTGVPSGMLSLDRVTDGWQKTDLIILAARPGMGKTGLVCSILRNAAVRFNIPVAIFSLEMASLQLVNRLISAESEVDSDRIKKGNFSEGEWSRVVERTNKLSTAPLYIDDTPALSILELRAKARRLKMQNGVQLIVVDYLQLMKGDNEGNREQEIASISRALKALAKELDIPVIALSQLSRGVETRGGDKRPQLSDLRESGAIEQDADMVMFLYRPEYYKITVDEDGVPTTGMAEVIIAKHRNGPLDNVKLKFIGQYTKFEDWNYTPEIERGLVTPITGGEPDDFPGL